MRNYFVYSLFIISVFLFADTNNPIDFVFSDPSTWDQKMAPLLYSNSFDPIEEMRINFPPTYYEIGENTISFMDTSESGASWYSREFKYNQELDGYEFIIYQYAGRTSTARIIYKEESDEMRLFIKGSGIWGDSEWLDFAEIAFCLYNYQP